MTAQDAIRNTLNRFVSCFDLKDWATMQSLLDPTIRVDYVDLRGQACDMSAVDYVAARIESLQHLRTHHLLANLVIEIDDGTASVDASCMIYRSDGSRHFDSHALYTFGLVAHGDRWTIAAIRQRILWNEGDPSIHKGASTRAS